MAISTPATIGTGTDTNNDADIVLTTSTTVPSNSKIWVQVAWFSGTTLTCTVAGGGLTWRTDIQRADTGLNSGIALCSADAPSGLASSTNLTATLSGASASKVIMGCYSTGVQTGDVDYGNNGTGSSTGSTWTTGNTTQAVASGDIAIGACKNTAASGSPTNTASGGNTEVNDVSTGDGEAGCSVYQFGAGSALAASGTWTSSNATSQVVAAYPAAAGNEKVGAGIIGP